MQPSESDPVSPPFESKLEEELAHNIEKYLCPEVKIEPQFNVETPWGEFRLDFIITRPGAAPIGLECDGVQFHDPARDEWRDSLILGTSDLKAIYRFPGPALVYHLEDCLYLLSKWEPACFSKRGHINLDRLASKEAKGADLGSPSILIGFKIASENGRTALAHSEICRHAYEGGKGSGSYFESLFLFAMEHKGKKLEEIQTLYFKRLASDDLEAF